MTEPTTNEPGRRPLGDTGRLLGALVVVATGAAAFAMAFRAALLFVYEHAFRAHDVLSAIQRLPLWLRVVVPAFGALLAGVVTRLSTRTSGHGVGDVMEAVVLGRTRLSVRATSWKALASWLAIATGGSVGREGPLIQFGGALGAAVARVGGIGGARARALIATGTAAGFAAAYNTPLAAVLFVVEIVTGVIAIEPLVLVLAGTALATALVRATVGGGPIYGQRSFTLTSPAELLAHALLGVLAALTAQAFMQLLAAGETAFARARLSQPWRAMVGGALVGTMAMFLPEVTGNGYEPLNLLLDGRYALATIAVLVFAKAFATTSSVAAGSPGGVFTPSLLIGGGLGVLFGHAVSMVTGTPESAGSYALVGMAAMTAATTHAPLMASVLVFELSEDYAIVLPLLAATATATFVSRRIRRDSIYTAELRRRGVHWELTLDGRRSPESRPAR